MNEDREKIIQELKTLFNFTENLINSYEKQTFYQKNLLVKLLESLKENIERFEKFDDVQQEIDLICKVLPDHTEEKALMQINFYSKNPDVISKAKMSNKTTFKNK